MKSTAFSNITLGMGYQQQFEDITDNGTTYANMSDKGISTYLQLSPAQQVIIGSYLTLIGVLSCSGNSIILLVFWKFPTLRTTTNVFLANLAIADLGISIFGFPFTAASNFNKSWLWGQTSCQWYGFNGMLFGLGNIGFLTAISFDRYLITCKYDLYSRFKKKHYGIASILLWANGALWAAAPLLGWSCYAEDITNTYCAISWTCNKQHFTSYIFTVTLLCFIIPSSIIIGCYTKTYKFMKKLGCGGLQENVEWTHQQQMCVVAIVMFLLAWIPFAVFYVWSSLVPPETLPLMLHIMPPLFAKSSALYNPFIYALVNKRFRVATKMLLCCNSDGRDLDAIQMQPIRS